MLDTDFELKPYGKTNRLKGMEVTITEKLDGTNGCIFIEGDKIGAQSRNRMLQVGKVDGKDNDNFGFASWVHNNREELFKLGDGYHYGEWCGPGIQKNPMGMEQKEFFLFNTFRPVETLPQVVRQVPIVYQGSFQGEDHVLELVEKLTEEREYKPEGVIVYFHDFRTVVKFTADGNQPKWKSKHM